MRGPVELCQRSLRQDKGRRLRQPTYMLTQIQTEASLDDIHDFIPLMQETEDNNYSLFKLVNELNNEFEILETEKNRLLHKIEILTKEVEPSLATKQDLEVG